MSIRILDKDTINQIAAGEVIDRPSSIIKELVENSIDAGAKAVAIEIRGGGIDLIRISDNGCGIDAADVRIAFIRHSTSKIKDASDLYNITSLGFRGEALASIAAIADVELITKTRDAFTATSYHIRGGEELGCSEIGAPDGTTFIIRDVFGNVPVRRKFLKSPITEGSYCNEVVERIALSHPEVSIKYVNNGRTLIFTNGSGKLKNVIFGIYGRDIAEETLEIEKNDLEENGIKNAINIYGCICRPTVARNNRNTENYFVNGRYIRSAIISKAVEDAYQPYLMQHKYPFVNLFIDIDPSKMDVNVHPSKQEVRFENPEIIYNAVFLACSEILAGKALIHRISGEKADKSNKTEQRAIAPEPFEQSAAVPKTAPDNNKPVVAVNSDNISEKKSFIYSDEACGSEKISVVKEQISFTKEEKPDSHSSSDKKQNDEKYVQQELFPVFNSHIEDKKDFINIFSKGYRIVGQVFNTYWIIECNGCMYMIDQHAAHEKILYEKLMGNLSENADSQLLSPPVIVSLTAREADIVERYSDELIKCGYTVEAFGGREYAVTSVPLNLYGNDPKSLLFEIIEGLSSETGKTVSEGIKDRIATCSCKAAVKGNMELSEPEARELIKQLLEAENPFNCPHGRPVIIDMTRNEIEKKFKRIL